MARSMQSMWDVGQDAVGDVKDRVFEMASSAADTAGEAARNLQRAVDRNRRPAADRLEQAASAIRRRAGDLPGGKAVKGFACGAAGKLRSTAKYIRKHRVQDMIEDAGEFIRDHPGRSLVAAVAVGYLVGRTFRRDA